MAALLSHPLFIKAPLQETVKICTNRRNFSFRNSLSFVGEEVSGTKPAFAQGRDSLWGGRKTPQPPEIDAYCGVVTARGPQSSCRGWRRIWAAHATPEGAHSFVLAFLSPDHLEVTGRSRQIFFLPG